MASIDDSSLTKKAKAAVGIFFAGIILASGLSHFKLSKENLILCGLLLLLVIITELAEFNAWGFKGKTRLLNEATETLNGESINADKDREQVLTEENVQTPQLNLMDPDTGNFLRITFEIERLLRIYAESMGQKDASRMTLRRIVDYLFKAEVITAVGKMRLDSVIKLRNFLVHGRNQEISESDLQIGFDLANSFYQELYQTMFSEQEGSDK